MGATDFKIRVSGGSAKEAFDTAVCDAQHEYGHSGYTGTIAEKTQFVMVDLTEMPEGTNPDSFARDLMDADDPRYMGKYGPCGCLRVKANVRTGTDEWIFFGLASD